VRIDSTIGTELRCGRARRGGSGALYPQSALAGSNSRLRCPCVGLSRVEWR